MAVDHISSLKAMVWEEAKGKLRALAALSGSGRERTPDYQSVSRSVEAFIKDFEDDGFQE